MNNELVEVVTSQGEFVILLTLLTVCSIAFGYTGSLLKSKEEKEEVENKTDTLYTSLFLLESVINTDRLPVLLCFLIGLGIFFGRQLARYTQN